MFRRPTHYVLAGFSLFSIAAYAVPPVFSTIDFPGGDSSEALGINNGGQIVGYYTVAGQFHGYLFSGGVFSVIDFPGSSGTIPASINNAGDVVGVAFGRRNRARLRVDWWRLLYV